MKKVDGLDRAFGLFGGAAVGLILGIIVAYIEGKVIMLPPSSLELSIILGLACFGAIIGTIYPRYFSWITDTFTFF